jgi:hypothetical protein
MLQTPCPGCWQGRTAAETCWIETQLQSYCEAHVCVAGADIVLFMLFIGFSHHGGTGESRVHLRSARIPHCRPAQKVVGKQAICTTQVGSSLSFD